MVDGPGWVDGFSPLIHKSHPDYPFLLPSLVAQAWRLFGESPAVSMGVAAVFAGLAVLVLGTAVGHLKRLATEPHFTEDLASYFARMGVSA